MNIHAQKYTGGYVLDEAVTLTRVRTGSFDAATALAGRIRGTDPYPSVVELSYTTPDDVTDALDVYRRSADHDLSFTDAMTIALRESRGFDAVCSFDSDFDGLVDRIEPGS